MTARQQLLPGGFVVAFVMGSTAQAARCARGADCAKP